jgi:hypothetical protein
MFIFISTTEPAGCERSIFFNTLKKNVPFSNSNYKKVQLCIGYCTTARFQFLNIHLVHRLPQFPVCLTPPPIHQTQIKNGMNPSLIAELELEELQTKK